MKMKTLAALGAAFAAVHTGLSALTFYEVFDRNAKLPGIVNSMTKKKSPPPTDSEDPRLAWMHRTQFCEVTLTNSRGEKLQGYFLPSETESKNFVLCSHGYRCDGKGEFRFITKFYHDKGFNVLLVDHIASGRSEGKRITFGYNEHKDLRMWVDYLIEKFGSDIKIALHGVSMGAATVMMLSGTELPENVRYAVEDCGFTTERDQFRNVLRGFHIPSRLLIDTADIINRLVCGFSFEDVRPIDSVKKAKIPILFVHGEADNFVLPYMVQDLYAACASDKDMFTVSGADHGVSYRKDSEGYEKKIKEFAEKYMDMKFD